MGISAATTAAAKVPCILRILTPAMREVIVVTLMLILAALQFALDPWYGAKILQHEPDQSDCHQHNFSDTRPVLVLAALLLASHLALPIRWVCLVPLEAALGLLYVGFAFVLGGPDGQHAWSTLLLVQGLVACAIIGRRTIEDHQRHTFCTIINERNLRAQSEYRMEEQHGSVFRAGSRVERYGCDSDMASRPDTSPSCVAFEVLTGDQSLDHLIALGRKEQWYVSVDELKLSTHVLGQGGYGMVLLGDYHGAPVAIKLNKLSIFDKGRTEDQLLASLNEVRILRRVRHPNIVLFHGLCLDAGPDSAAIVLESVTGETLEAVIREGDQQKEQLQPHDRLHALAQISRALRYLHSRGPPVVHGDLKPANIIAEQVPGLAGFHRVKLLDFGLARALTRHAKPLGGTLLWMAPELVLEPSQKPQTGADVFSFGRVAFFTLTGVMALKDKSSKEIVDCIEQADLPAEPWPPALELSLASCRQQVEACLEFTAAARPSMEMVGEFLESQIGDAFGEVTRDWSGLSSCQTPGFSLSIDPTAAKGFDSSGSQRLADLARGSATAAPGPSGPKALNAMPIIPGTLEGSGPTALQSCPMVVFRP